MRTTIRLDEQLLKRAKLEAAATGRTFTQLVEDSLRESLARRSRSRRAGAALPIHKGGRVLPGVDLHDSAALLELMEEARADP